MCLHARTPRSRDRSPRLGAEDDRPANRAGRAAPARSAPAVSAELAERLGGAEIGALGRRGKYILIELDADGLLLLHLGMSGRITAGDAAVPAVLHDHVVLTLDDGTVVRFNDARRFGLFDYVRRSEAAPAPAARRARPRAARTGFRRRLSRREARRQDDPDQIGACSTSASSPGSATSMSARRSIARDCRRGGSPERSAAAGPTGSSRRSARCSTKPSRPAARRCATMSRRTASSAISSTAGRSTATRASPVRAAIARRRAPHRSVRPVDVLLRQTAALEEEQMSETSQLPEHPRRAARGGRHRHPQPPAGAERAERGLDRRARRGNRRFRRRRGDRRDRADRQRQGFCRRRRRQGDGGQDLSRNLSRGFHHQGLGAGRAMPQAGRRRGGRLCARRRLRNRDDVRHRHRRRQRALRPARDHRSARSPAPAGRSASPALSARRRRWICA